MKEQIHKFFTEKIMRFSWQRVGFVLLVIVVVAGVFAGVLSVYGYAFRERVLPGINWATLT